MKRKYIDLNYNERKLHKLSIFSISLLYSPLFGYSLNKEMIYIWLVITLFGGISLIATSKWIRLEMRRKVITYILVLTIALDILIFSDQIWIPMFIKQLIFFSVFFSFGYIYFKLLYNDNLAIRDE